MSAVQKGSWAKGFERDPVRMSEGLTTTNSPTELSWRTRRSYPSGMQKFSGDSEIIQKFSKGVGTSSWEVVMS
jgi:hypothetical protein